METLYPECELIRKLPENCKEEHASLFSGQLCDKSRAVYLKQFEKVTLNNELFLKNWITILPESFGDYWQNQVYNSPLYLSKSFIKDRLRRNRKIEEGLLILDTFSTGGYFHWITEIIPKLKAAEKLNSKIPILIPQYFFSKWGFSESLLKSIKRPIIQFSQEELLKIDKLWWIGQAGGPLNYQPEMLQRGISQLLSFFYDPDFQGSPPEYLYVSRKRSNRRIVLNESETEKVTSDYGFQTLEMEDLSIYEQVNIFSRAKVVLAIHGAALSNMVFMKKGSTVIEIRHPHKDHMLNFFFTLASSCDHKYYYCLGMTCRGKERLHEKREAEKSLYTDLGMLQEVLSEALGGI